MHVAADANSQMLKGILQGCLLILLARKEQYGYAISESLDLFGFGDVPKGTIYPLLLKLQKNKLIVGVRRPTGNGPDRKYYHLTDAGQDALADFQQQWQQLAQAMAQLNQGGTES